MQAYLAAQEGVRELATETGAGQWGSALAHAGERFGVDVRVFMVRASFRQKPGRRTLMKLSGARVEESPGPSTDAGRAYCRENPDHPGSLGIAIAEAVETVLSQPGSKYALGSVLDSVLLHQSRDRPGGRKAAGRGRHGAGHRHRLRGRRLQLRRPQLPLCRTKTDRGARRSILSPLSPNSARRSPAATCATTTATAPA